MIQFTVEFFGVRGSTATNSSDKMEYGCNTSCVLVTAGEQHIILDMGTGIVSLGNFFIRQGLCDASVLLGHFHYDHIEGFPFFQPFYKEGSYRIYGRPRDGKSVRELLEGYMRQPYFPVTSEIFGADVTFYDLSETAEFTIGELLTVKAIESCHPGGATAYKLTLGGRSLVYLTDYEHGSPREQAITEFCNGAHMLIYDANFTQKEYDKGRYSGWGHSTCEAGVTLAKNAGVDKLVLTHHASKRTDDEIKELGQELQGLYPRVIMAKEGLILSI
ncbi:MAG: MBL fold metallo-hydrolase [Anaerovorax sp.]